MAATNDREALDDALFRRFDDVLACTLPRADFIEPAIRCKLSTFNVNAVDWAVVREVADGLSYADITHGAEAAAKEMVLDDAAVITTAALGAALRERRTHRATA